MMSWYRRFKTTCKDSLLVVGLIVSLLAVILPVRLWAEESAGEKKTLTLNECIAIALKNNVDILVSEEDIAKALAEYRAINAQRNIYVGLAAKSSQYPKVTQSDLLAAANYFPFPYNYYIYWYDKKKQEGKLEISRYYNIGLSFGLTAGITIFNEKKNRMVDVASSSVRLSKYQGAKAVQDAIYNVKKAYYTYAIARENVTLREKLYKSSQDKLKITEMLFRGGQKTALDVSKARYDLSESALELQKAKNNERALRTELFRVLGIPDTGTAFELENTDISMKEIRYSAEDLYAVGETNFPDLQMVKTQKEITRNKIAVEMGGHYPEVDIQGGVGYENGRIDLYDFGSSLTKKNNWKLGGSISFTANLPLFAGGMVTARVDAAKAEYRRALYKEREARNAMKTTIAGIITTLEELKTQVGMAALMKENAEKHMLLAKKAYESGTGTQLELHEAQNAMINAEVGYQKIKLDYLMTLARLSSIVGLGEETLCAK